MKFKEKIDIYTYSLTHFFMENDHVFSKRKTVQVRYFEENYNS